MKKRKGYIFTNKKHSQRAIMSTILGVISLTALGIAVFLAYRSAGAATTGLGFTGVFALIFSAIGEILGVLTLSDKNYYRLFPVLGTVLNLVSLAGLSLILYAGANL